MIENNPLFNTDFYKTIHHKCYPEKTQYLTSYFIPRTSRIEDSDGVVFFGLQAFLKNMDKSFQDVFEHIEYVYAFADFLEKNMGDKSIEKPLTELNRLGYLPLKVRALPEGTLAPIGTPVIEIKNTHPDFFWLPGFLETWLSNSVWYPTTSATTARRYFKLLNETLQHKKTDKVPFMCSDFGQRGMTSMESAGASGAGHLLFFDKTANIPGIRYLDKYYSWDQRAYAGTPSTEHSIMCAYGEDELKAFNAVLDQFPTGNISIVSDTYDLWKVISDVLPQVRERILERAGTVLIRPDSGDPVEIVCGNNNQKGVVELLWNLFGGSVDDMGLRVLDSHIKVIYGDAITIDRCDRICVGLMRLGFSPLNVVFGIGSYTYQYVTRDTYGFALKATHAIIDGQEKMLFKDPITDTNHIKKSPRGLCEVGRVDGKIKYVDGLTIATQRAMKKESILQLVYENGNFYNNQTLDEIRKRCRNV